MSYAPTRDIKFVDIDNDDDLDVFVVNRGTTLVGEVSRFYVNQGGLQSASIGFFAEDTDNRWGSLVSVSATDELPPVDGQGPWRGWSCDCEFGDLDDDGHADLFASSYGPNIDGSRDSRIFTNDGTGVFDELYPWANPGADTKTHTIDLDLVDLDSDFDLDVVMSSLTSQARIYLNNLNNGISAAAFNDITQFALINQGATLSGGNNYEGEYGDVDGDGDFDNWMVSYNGLTDRILRNDGFVAGQGVKFTKQDNWIKNDPVADEQEVDFFDYDGDGDLDAFHANFSGTNWIYQSGLAQGLNPATTGLFHRSGVVGGQSPNLEGPVIGWSGTSLDADVADVDNDGDHDVAVANGSNQSNYLYLNALGVPDVHAPDIHAITDQADKPNGSSTVIHVALRDNETYHNVDYYEVDLVYAVDGGAPVTTPMFAQGSMQFRGLIPAQSDALVEYHVEATDLAGNTGASGDFDYVQGGPGGSPWTDLGFSLAGISGPPLLAGSGTLLAGSAGALSLTNAASSAACVLFVSLVSTPVPFKGGTLATIPFATLLPLATSGSGSVVLPWAAWPAGLSGLDLHFQYAISDAAGPAGAALSNCVRGEVP